MPTPMTAQEVARTLGVSLTTVKRRAKNGTLPTTSKLPGRTGAYLFDRDAVEQAHAADLRADAIVAWAMNGGAK